MLPTICQIEMVICELLFFLLKNGLDYCHAWSKGKSYFCHYSDGRRCLWQQGPTNMYSKKFPQTGLFSGEKLSGRLFFCHYVLLMLLSSRLFQLGRHLFKATALFEKWLLTCKTFNELPTWWQSVIVWWRSARWTPGIMTVWGVSVFPWASKKRLKKPAASRLQKSMRISGSTWQPPSWQMIRKSLFCL